MFQKHLIMSHLMEEIKIGYKYENMVLIKLRDVYSLFFKYSFGEQPN